MKNNLPKRKNNRLQGYDYSQAGYYFVTICVKDKRVLLWEDIPVGARIARPSLSATGKIIEKAINQIHAHYPMISIDKYVVMPNHIHMILIISAEDNGNVVGNGRAMRAPTLPTVINQMKGYVTKQIGYSVWQKLFHDHIIRNEKEYQKIWQYIDENPQKWADDCYFR